MELREIVARAIGDADRALSGQPPVTDDEWHRINPWEAEWLDLAAHAAIAAMWPVMREMCAGVADGYMGDHDDSYWRTAENIATAIRSLEQPK